MSTFSNFFPRDCPPKDAAPGDGAYFRLIKKAQPAPEDFMTYAEKGLFAREACLRFGLSICGTADGAEAMYCYMQRRHPEGTQLGSHIAVVKVEPTSGVLKQTGRPPHYTWWLFEGIDRLSTFQFVLRVCQCGV